MKKVMLGATLLATLFFGYGCSGKKDSNEAAKDVNETKIDDNATANTGGASEGDQKDESTYLVDLANTGLTEYELSKLAADRAMNPGVKSYAQATVKQHATDEKELRDMAQSKNLTLPTTLSKDSQDMLADLSDEKAGKDFDKKYLDQMEDVNDKAISKAKGVENNTKDQAMRTFIAKILSDDEKHKAEAKTLKDAM